MQNFVESTQLLRVECEMHTTVAANGKRRLLFILRDSSVMSLRVALHSCYPATVGRFHIQGFNWMNGKNAERQRRMRLNPCVEPFTPAANRRHQRMAVA